MADNKMGPNLQAGAGFLAKRVQKSLNRAQEKVLQKLGKTMETKDEQFELCFQNLNKQQMDGNRLSKDVRAHYAAVKAVHETSKRLSQTLRDVYESDWNGVEDLAVITESEDLLWNDYEEKLSDQIVRTMENYISQFPEVKERVAKRGRKLVDYDSARHHLEALQSAKKKDELKITKAEEEFNKSQNVFEEMNRELREELPVLYQSRIGCYVTVFQNMSNLRDVFYKEMSVLNHELYNVMKKLETQHSGKAFIVKGLNSSSSKSKKRKSLVISNPIPCNTAFPADHVSIHPSTQNDAAPVQRAESISEESGAPSNQVSSSDSDLSSSGANSPRRRSESDDSPSPEEREAELAARQSDDSGVGVPPAGAPSREVASESAESEAASGPDQSSKGGLPESAESEAASGPDQSSEGGLPESAESEPASGPDQSSEGGPPESAESEAASGPDQSSEGGPPESAESEAASGPDQSSEGGPPESAESEAASGLDRGSEGGLPSQEAQPGPVPAPRVSSRSADRSSVVSETDEDSVSRPTTEPTDDSSSQDAPGFLYKVVATESQEASGEQLQFEQGDVILVLDDAAQGGGMVRGIREETWNLHHHLENLSGIFSEKLVQRVQAE